MVLNDDTISDSVCIQYTCSRGQGICYHMSTWVFYVFSSIIISVLLPYIVLGIPNTEYLFEIKYHYLLYYLILCM